jgi:hypothetical protein
MVVNLTAKAPLQPLGFGSFFVDNVLIIDLGQMLKDVKTIKIVV